jgi:hypothetical protein
MARFFERTWNESRGDRFDDWGTSLWYFEVDDDLWPSRQIEIYASGDVLTYDRNHIEDDYGGLSEAALDDPEWDAFEISSADFERVWESAKPRNR